MHVSERRKDGQIIMFSKCFLAIVCAIKICSGGTRKKYWEGTKGAPWKGHDQHVKFLKENNRVFHSNAAILNEWKWESPWGTALYISWLMKRKALEIIWEKCLSFQVNTEGKKWEESCLSRESACLLPFSKAVYEDMCW